MSPQLSHSGERFETLAAESLSPRQDSNPLQNVRNALVEAGLHEKGVEKMDLEGIKKLVPILERGEKHSALVIKIFNAVTETNPGKLNKLIDILSVYSGNFSILGQFLERVGHMDPFIATSRAQLLILPAEGLPSTRGASGHLLHGLTYCAYDHGAPTDTVGYFSKKQAITRIFEAFNPERMSGDSQHQTRQRRSSVLREALRDISLHDLEQNPELAGETGSHLIVRNLEVYTELRKAIAECKAHLTDLVYDGSMLLSGVRSIKVSEDPGRQFYGWFEEHLKENPNVPRGIRIAYESLKDPDIALSPEDERNYLRGLLSYQRLHSYINKDVALGGLIQDLKEYEALSVNDPLRLDEAVERARQDLKHIAGDGYTEMTIAEFGRLLELSGMVEFRKSMNQRALDTYGAEFAQALSHFDFVSFKDGKWREDALGDSVPMDRLKKHLYGAKIGISQAGFSDDRRQALLSQRDFKAVSEAQFLERLIPDQDRRISAMAITDFRSMVEGVIAAHRKAMHFDGLLDEYRKTPVGAALTINREDVGTALQQWKPVLLIGSRYRPAETWIPEGSSPAHAFSIGEISRRLKDRSASVLTNSSSMREQRHKFSHEIDQGAAAGLYVEEMALFWKKAGDLVAPLVDAQTVSEKIDRAVTLVANPLLVSSGLKGQHVLAYKYLFPAEIKQIDHLLAQKEEIERLSEPHRAELSSLAERVQKVIYVDVHSGGIYENEGQRRLTLRTRPFSSYVGKISVPGLEHIPISYYDPEKLKEALAKLESSYVPIATLDRDWLDRARAVCSKAGREQLARQGLNLVDTETFRFAQGLRINSPGYISRRFVDAINLIAPPVKGLQ